MLRYEVFAITAQARKQLVTLHRRMEDIFEEDGILYIIDHDDCKIILIPVLQNSILYKVHNRAISGHMGIQKTLDKFCSKFYWPGAHRIVSDYMCRNAKTAKCLSVAI